MKIIRSTKCILKYSTASKKNQLDILLKEYKKVVNFFINHFWKKEITKKDLTKNILDLPETWLSSRLKLVAAREALDMIYSTKEIVEWNKEQISYSISSIEYKINEIKNRENTKRNRRKINNLYCKLKKIKMKYDMMVPHKPKHHGKRICASALIANLEISRQANKFDAWLHLSSLGNKIKIDFPIKFHNHFNELDKKGKRLNSYIITKDYVQFSFEIKTGEKKPVKTLLGIDSGIKALASLSNEEQLGTKVEKHILRIKRCKWGSKGHKKASVALRNYISITAKRVVSKADLIVVEKLRNLNNNIKLKERLSKNIRSSIGSWNYSYWLKRLEQLCENNRVSFRTVSPYYTSQKCSKCGYTNSTNRNGELFRCRKCYHTGNADINAARNILERFVTGKYGTCYKTVLT